MHNNNLDERCHFVEKPIEDMSVAEMLDLCIQMDIEEALEAWESKEPEEADNGEAFGYCVVCREEFPIEELNHRGECPTHDGETEMSDEEREDWASYIENLNKQF